MDVKKIELVAALLKSQSSVALATSDADGSPRLAPLFYLPGEGLRLYWFSSATSRHARNLKRDPSAAVAVYRPTDEWKQICGVQMRGSVAVVKQRARRKQISAAYAERFRLGPLFEATMSRARLYEFRPRWIRYLDNSRRFGYKFEMTLPPEGG